MASLSISNNRVVDDDFPDEEISIVTNFLGWNMYFDEATKSSENGIGVLFGDHISRSVHLVFFYNYSATNNINRV